MRHQAGANFARTISVAPAFLTAAGAIYSGTINAEPLNPRRHDNITVVVVRAERSFALGGTVRWRTMFDLFNITNTTCPVRRFCVGSRVC